MDGARFIHEGLKVAKHLSSSPRRFTSVTMRGVRGQTATGRAVVTKRMCSSVKDLGVKDISDCLGEHVTLSVCLYLLYVYHLSMCPDVHLSINLSICRLSVGLSIHLSSAIRCPFVTSAGMCHLWIVQVTIFSWQRC